MARSNAVLAPLLQGFVLVIKCQRYAQVLAGKQKHDGDRLVCLVCWVLSTLVRHCPAQIIDGPLGSCCLLLPLFSLFILLSHALPHDLQRHSGAPRPRPHTQT